MNTTSTVSPDSVAPRRRLLAHPSRVRFENVRTPIVCGVIAGGVIAATPLGFWWLPPATVYALAITFIAAVYVGFSVADGRWSVIAVEVGVATAFVITAATAVTGPAWLLVAGLTGHGLKDLWQHHTRFVANTRWWPPFCVAADWVAAAILAAALAAGFHFHQP